ncbi:MAG: hypothetical protein IJA85_01355 [Clostridia bacterium]|nr:hypothetical protein [Clostridia bacterium]
MKKLNFNIPFSDFCWQDFLNCFAAVHVYLADMPHNEDYVCAEKAGRGCNDCGNCKNSIGNIQNDYYFIFGAVTGCASFLEDYDNTRKNPKDDKLDDVIDFCMKYAGYDYRVATDNMFAEAKLSLDAGIPVLAQLKEQSSDGPYRILIGYDDEKRLWDVYTQEQGADEITLTADDIKSLCIITKKTAPAYTLADGLKNIEKALVDADTNGIWTQSIPMFDYWKVLEKLPIEEIKKRFERVKTAAWNFDRCHNFKSAMDCLINHPTYRESLRTMNLSEDKLRRCAQLGADIERVYHSSHELQWAVISLYDCRHFTKKEMDPVEAGMCECARIIIRQLAQNDRDVLEAVRELIKELSEFPLIIND